MISDYGGKQNGIQNKSVTFGNSTFGVDRSHHNGGKALLREPERYRANDAGRHHYLTEYLDFQTVQLVLCGGRFIFGVLRPRSRAKTGGRVLRLHTVGDLDVDTRALFRLYVTEDRTRKTDRAGDHQVVQTVIYITCLCVGADRRDTEPADPIQHGAGSNNDSNSRTVL